MTTSGQADATSRTGQLSRALLALADPSSRLGLAETNSQIGQHFLSDREAVTAATSFTVVLIRHAEGEMMPISPQLMPLLP